MSTGLAVFDTTVQETNEWLAALEKRLRCDRHQAYSYLRAVMHTLRDQLPLHGMIGLSAQLPMLLRGLVLEGWRPEGTVAKTDDPDQFNEVMLARLPASAELEPYTIVRAVMSVMAERIDPGEMANIMSLLPAGQQTYWPANIWAE